MENVSCVVCSATFAVKPYRVSIAKYCSYACRDEGMRRAERKPSTEKKVTNTCPQCGNLFEVVPSRAKHGRGLHCSPACQHKTVSERLNRGVEVVCVGCGVRYSRAPSHVRGVTGKGKYCSRSCRDTNRIGSAHPQFITGPSPSR